MGSKYQVGQIYGNKVLTEDVGLNKYKQRQFLWACVKCGKAGGPTTGTDISRHQYTKCCPRRYDEKVNYRGHRLITGSKITQIKDGARRRGLAFDVTAEYLWSVWESQGGTCAYSGLPIELNNNASLDRIDSSLGYVEGNVHWVLWAVNRMKMNIPHEEFIRLCSLIASRNGEEDEHLDT